MHIPHEYTQADIAANLAGLLTWHWIWEQVGAVIAADPQQLVDYQPFVDYLRVSTTQRAPVAVEGQIRLPATTANIVPAITMPSIQDQAMAHAATYWTRSSFKPDHPRTCDQHGSYCKCPTRPPAYYGKQVPHTLGLSTTRM
jgi:hypothetical protein